LHVPTREGETFIIACGDENAPPLMLLHGSAANSAMWMRDVAAWAAYFRVYAICDLNHKMAVLNHKVAANDDTNP
jgi:hypothetical protein